MSRILNFSYELIGFPPASTGRVPKLSYGEGEGVGGSLLLLVSGRVSAAAFMSRVPYCFYGYDS